MTPLAEPVQNILHSPDPDGNGSPSPLADSEHHTHTVPSKEKDILLLQKFYHEAGCHEFSNRRKITRDKDKVKDYTTRGYKQLHMAKVIER
jgi:hypothetical protein